MSKAAFNGSPRRPGKRFSSRIDAIAQRRLDALVVANDGFLNSQRDQLMALTMQGHIPADFANRELVEAGDS